MKSPKLRVPGKGTPARNAFSNYSLLGSIEELEKWLMDRKPILNSLCYTGDAGVWYAKYNTGKTLLMLSMLVDAVAAKRINGCDVIYVNADDTAHGLLEKLRIMEDYGIHMVAPGQRGFTMEHLLLTMIEMIETDTARGRLVIVDTLKRAVDVMDKKRVRAFTRVVRSFVMKGGSFLALAHTNKNLGQDAKPIPEGTGDVLNDFDTGYLIDCVGEIKGSGDRLVEFVCKKSRGEVSQSVHFSYDPDPSLSYLERLLSVQEVDLDEVKYAPSDNRSPDEDDLIRAIELSIIHGSATKMAIVRTASMATKESQRSVLAVLERLTGSDPLVHRWGFVRGEHGRMKYSLLDRPDAA